MKRDLLSLPPVHADERISYGTEPNQFFDLWQPQEEGREPRGAVVMIHGGFWRARYDLTHASHACAALARAGLTVASLEYRRVGDSGGGWPGTFEDIVDGFTAACAHCDKSASVVLLGHSAGGHLALRFAGEKSAMRGVVALAPVACLDLADELHLSHDAVSEFLGGGQEQAPTVYEAACPSRHALKTPAIVVHGALDETVPVSLSRCFLERRAAENLRLVEIAGAKHMDLIDPVSAAWVTVLECVMHMIQDEAA
ncbi:MAG TPA: alpha/beta hydrolase [Acidobacteriaceae bacterium]|jgi:acetyl esterase/lipase|nr:alpha/beta hydrolase [Acidobacteriaceae bacterium]